MGRSWLPMVALGMLLGTSGCLGTGTRDIFHPGDEKTQVVRAQVYDPYPENDLGPPIVGGRPPDFDSPRAEVLRVQPRLGEPLLAPVQGPAPTATCPPGYAPTYAPAYTPGYPQGAAPPAGNVAPGWTASQGQSQGNVIYVPPPPVDNGAAAGPP